MPDKIKIKPLSVNDCWQGRRFKTKAYNDYEKELFYLLPKKLKIPKGKKLKLRIWWGFSSKASDIDNPVKPLLDILQKKYGFNDKSIYQMVVEKEDVGKGEEYIIFIFDVLPVVYIGKSSYKMDRGRLSFKNITLPKNFGKLK